ncbi:hypothetical protein B0H63DRAFT_515444 [Podospora didyma]|uniref:Tat pathway signal sequence n=1 Tax=Podospora didyma TaxID=330526 RepID=A0AAE0K0B9_9PEZI|nr:hypothetical protein B0H63DRAFT_515444 [Podospora didyma]
MGKDATTSTWLPTTVRKFFTRPLKTESDFNSVAQSEDHEALLSPYRDTTHRENGHTKPSPLPEPRKHIATVALIVPALLSFLLGLWLGDSNLLTDPDTFCTSQLRLYSSPVVDSVPLHFTTTEFNGSFLRENIYRQPPSPEVDAAWEDLGTNYRSMLVPPDKAAAAGLTPSHVQVSPNHHDGGGHVALIEGLHHLHCLDLMRQALHWNIEYYRAKGSGPWLDKDDFVRKHVNHCLDILRQQLMCSPDLSVLGSVWFVKDGDNGGGKGHASHRKRDRGRDPQPFVDFNTKHKCVDFDAVRDWAEKMQFSKAEMQEKDFFVPPKEEDIIIGLP